MSATDTVSQYEVTPAVVQANTDAALYVAEQGEILAAAASVAAAMIVAGKAEGVPVAAIVPVITAIVAQFPAKLAAAAAVAQAPF